MEFGISKLQLIIYLSSNQVMLIKIRILLNKSYMFSMNAKVFLLGEGDISSFNISSSAIVPEIPWPTAFMQKSAL